MASGEEPDGDGIIYEFIRIGGSVKVTAVDPVTYIEVSIVGSPLVSDAELMRLARRKLDYVLAKRGRPRAR
ncbi:MAG TPA: hypothetical protein VGB88_06465 [Alphaproteobacteria bacterium]